MSTNMKLLVMLFAAYLIGAKFPFVARKIGL